MSVRDATVLKSGRARPHSWAALQPQPLGPASAGHLLQHPVARTPRPPEGCSSGCQKLYRSQYQRDHSLHSGSATV